MQYLIWKVSINVSNISGRQERGSMDSIHQVKLKSSHLLHEKALVKSQGSRTVPMIISMTTVVAFHGELGEIQ